MCLIHGGDFGNQFSVLGIYVMLRLSCLMQEFFKFIVQIHFIVQNIFLRNILYFVILGLVQTGSLGQDTWEHLEVSQRLASRLRCFARIGYLL